MGRNRSGRSIAIRILKIKLYSEYLQYQQNIPAEYARLIELNPSLFNLDYVPIIYERRKRQSDCSSTESYGGFIANVIPKWGRFKAYVDTVQEQPLDAAIIGLSGALIAGTCALGNIFLFIYSEHPSSSLLARSWCSFTSGCESKIRQSSHRIC